MKLGFKDGCSPHSIRTLQTVSSPLCRTTPKDFPRLDAWLAAQVADPKHLKGEFGVSARAFVERAHALGVLPSGRALLAMLSKRFRVDRIRGASVSQQTLLAFQLEGFSQQHLQTFRQRVEFCLHGFSPDAWPAESTMFSWLYAKLKHCRLLSRSIDKIKDSSQGSVKRTFNWLWTQLIEHLDEPREEANEESIRDALVRPKVKGAPSPKQEGGNKPEPSVPANPAPPCLSSPSDNRLSLSQTHRKNYGFYCLSHFGKKLLNLLVEKFPLCKLDLMHGCGLACLTSLVIVQQWAEAKFFSAVILRPLEVCKTFLLSSGARVNTSSPLGCVYAEGELPQRMDRPAIRAQLAAVQQRLTKHRHQHNWYGFHIQRLETIWRDLQSQQSALACQIVTIRLSLLRVLSIVRQQRVFLRRIDRRVGQLEERLQVAFVRSADQADIVADLERAVVSGSDVGAADSGGSDFVVAGSPAPGVEEGVNFEPRALAVNLLEEVTRQVETQAEPSMCDYSPSLNPWDALSVSSFAHTSCAREASEPSVVEDQVPQSVLPADSGLRGAQSSLSSFSDLSSRRVDLGLAFGDAFGRVSDGGTSDLVMPWETRRPFSAMTPGLVFASAARCQSW